MSGLEFRSARREDVPAIVAMLADDPLGAARETVSDPPLPAYLEAFEAIDADPGHDLVVVEREGAVVGFLHVSWIPGLTRRGSRRALVEGVRVAASQRGQGVGRALMEHVIEQARARGCRLVQLTTDTQRGSVVEFYESLGFQATHVGLKLPLE